MDLLHSLLTVLDALNQGIHVVDEKGVTVVYNRAASALDGLSPDEVLGKDILSVFPSLDESSSTLLRVLRTGIPEDEQQQTFSNYKGRKITSLNFTRPILDRGEVTGAFEVSTDITRLKEMADKIADLEKELHDKLDPSAAKPRTRALGGDAPRRLFVFDDIVGESGVMKEVKRRALQVAKTGATAIVWGETGTGKELLVQAIHSASSRSSGPFVPQNCAALPESLLEGLLFGTARGGFTGSVDRSGLLELASGGTLYLDEIDSMPFGMQAKLLRVIQDQRVRRIGDTRERPLDLRILASTGKRPSEAVEKGLLRADLYYRLSVVEIGIPPLRARKEDIPLLCEHFLAKHSRSGGPVRVSPQVMAVFLAYDWPGNVRELEHAIEGSLTFAKGPSIELEDLPAAVRGISATASAFGHGGRRGAGSQDDFAAGQYGKSQISRDAQGFDEKARLPAAGAMGTRMLKELLQNAEREAIQRAIAEARSVTGAARILGMPRQTLQYRMKVLGLAEK